MSEMQSSSRMVRAATIGQQVRRYLRSSAASAGLLIACACTSSALLAAELGAGASAITPLGAEQSANKEGTIPAWSGGLTQPPKGWTPDKGYLDPFPADKPLYTIDAKNIEQHKAKLPSGLMELLMSDAEFRMPVYQTRRTAVVPKSISDVVAKEAESIKLSGDSLLGRSASSVPFPNPQSGAEVIWNHRLRYRGGVSEQEEYWYPIRDGKIQQRVGLRHKVAENAALDTPTSNGILFAKVRFVAPAILGKDEYFIHESIDASEDSRNWWVYNETQKRSRRLTAAGYDDLPPGVDELRTRDQSDAFNGSLNRYDWKLVGKRELIVPYNTYKLSDKRLQVEHLLGARSIKSDFMRYELHRVWVVEATLKPGMRHLYPKRTFYVDEDSWSILVEDAYDSRGKLWRVGMHGLIQFYDVQAFGYRVNIWHDLTNGAYLLSGLDIEAKSHRKFSTKTSLAEFTPGQMVTNKEGVK
jgi:hypothetical protein